MDIVLLIKSGMGLVVILAVLVFFLFYSAKKKKEKIIKQKEPVKAKVEKARTFDSLRAVLVNDKSTSKDLKDALDEIIKNYGKISKSGKSSKSDFDAYMGIIFNICRHPNTTKHIILDFDKELRNINPQYKSEINDAITKGLNARGV